MFGLDNLNEAPLPKTNTVPMCTVELGCLMDLSPLLTVWEPSRAFRTCEVDQVNDLDIRMGSYCIIKYIDAFSTQSFLE